MTRGAWGSTKALVGHSTNSAKLNRKTALIWISLEETVCADTFEAPANRQPNNRHRHSRFFRLEARRINVFRNGMKPFRTRFGEFPGGWLPSRIPHVAARRDSVPPRTIQPCPPARQGARQR